MKEIFEFRINNDYYHLLPKPNNGKDNGMVHVVRLTKDDKNFEQIKQLSKTIKNKNKDDAFYFGWDIKRSYSKKELEEAKLLHLKIKTVVEPAGEEFGTLYNEATACKICGANREQTSVLKLKKGFILKKDIAKTIAGEVIVSEKFAMVLKQRGLIGLKLEPIILGQETSKYYQLIAPFEVDLSQNTVVGINPFDFSEDCKGVDFKISNYYQVKIEKETYKCPNGDTIGLNLLSEPYVVGDSLVNGCDFFASKQKIGVKRGFLRPESLYFCSPIFKRMVEEEKLSGFEFEIANIE